MLILYKQTLLISSLLVKQHLFKFSFSIFKLLKMVLFTIFVASAMVFGATGRDIDNTKCFINDPDLNNCVLKALNALRLKDKQQGISLFDPFVIPKFEVVQETMLVNYTASCTNALVGGLDNFHVMEVSFDPETLTFHGRIEFEPVSLDCEYKMEGHLVYIPISGKGVAHAILGPLHTQIDVFGTMIKHKNGKIYNPTGMKLQTDMEEIQVHFNGLFDDNRQLAYITNQALKANSRMLAYAISPALDIVAETAFLKPVKHLFKNIIYA